MSSLHASRISYHLRVLVRAVANFCGGISSQGIKHGFPFRIICCFLFHMCGVNVTEDSMDVVRISACGPLELLRRGTCRARRDGSCELQLVLLGIHVAGAKGSASSLGLGHFHLRFLSGSLTFEVSYLVSDRVKLNLLLLELFLSILLSNLVRSNLLPEFGESILLIRNVSLVFLSLVLGSVFRVEVLLESVDFVLELGNALDAVLLLDSAGHGINEVTSLSLLVVLSLRLVVISLLVMELLPEVGNSGSGLSSVNVASHGLHRIVLLIIALNLGEHLVVVPHELGASNFLN
jgi:hypothetical protein